MSILPRFLLSLPLAIRICIAVLSAVLAIIAYIITSIHLHNPVVFTIPIVLAAWMLGWGGLWASAASLFGIVWVYLSDIQNQGNLLLPFPTSFNIIFCTVIILAVGLLTISQRNTLELTDHAQRQLELTSKQQQELYAIKDQLLQNVNHELRTPLTAIYGYLELLLEHNSQLGLEMRATFLRHAMQSCDELQLLVNNVLDSTRVEREKPLLHIEELPVLDIVNEVLERSDPRSLQEHDIQIDIADFIVVEANAQYLRQILRNLLSNAFKYAPPGTPLIISAALYGELVDPEHPAPEICIKVKDFGPGIPPVEIPKLFKQFVRLQRETFGKVRGTGLGLFISRQFVEVMGGRIWVESEGIPGKGSCFCFTLPCVPRSNVRAKTKVLFWSAIQVQSISQPLD